MINRKKDILKIRPQVYSQPASSQCIVHETGACTEVHAADHRCGIYWDRCCIPAPGHCSQDHRAKTTWSAVSQYQSASGREATHPYWQSTPSGPETTTSMSIHTHTHPFNGPLSGTTRVSRYQKGKPLKVVCVCVLYSSTNKCTHKCIHHITNAYI